MKTLQFNLELPINPMSTNSLYCRGRYGVYRSPSYSKWRVEVASMLAEQWNQPLLTGDVEVQIVFNVADKRRRDIDNMIKSLFDCFNGVVWVDDCQVQAVTARKVYKPLRKPVITVTIRSLQPCATFDRYHISDSQIEEAVAAQEDELVG